MTDTKCNRGWGMTGKVTIICLLSLIAIGTNSTGTVERTDLPLRTRIARNIANRLSYVKTAIAWYTIGHFTGAEAEPAELMQGPLDDKWIDCEHPADGYIDAGPDDDQYGDEFPAALIIPRGEWQQWITSNQAAGFSLTLYNDTLNYQAPEHSCVSNATETAIRVVRNRQLGLKHCVKLSPMSLYCRMNSHRWGGSNVFANLEEASSRGIVPEDTPENKQRFGSVVCHQNAVYFPASKLPAGWGNVAKHFRPLKFFRVRTSEQFASALLRGFPVVNGRSGHSICHLELVYRNGKFLSKYADSYGTNRGDGGYLYDTESKWATSGAWCLRSVTMPDDPAYPAGGNSGTWKAESRDPAIRFPLTAFRFHWRHHDETTTHILVNRLCRGDAWDAGRYRHQGHSRTLAA